MVALQRIVLTAFAGLALLAIAWEWQLAPLRPGGSWLVLKALPLMAALPFLARNDLRTYQWWSMLVLLYLAEGLMRATSDRGLSAQLAWIEVALSGVAFVAILVYVRSRRSAAAH